METRALAAKALPPPDSGIAIVTGFGSFAYSPKSTTPFFLFLLLLAPPFPDPLFSFLPHQL